MVTMVELEGFLERQEFKAAEKALGFLAKYLDIETVLVIAQEIENRKKIAQVERFNAILNPAGYGGTYPERKKI